MLLHINKQYPFQIANRRQTSISVFLLMEPPTFNGWFSSFSVLLQYLWHLFQHLTLGSLNLIPTHTPNLLNLLSTKLSIWTQGETMKF